MADNLIGSEIIQLATEVNKRIAAGEKIYNLTIGDFNPEIFSIPEVLKNNIINAYNNGMTNYPPANGLPYLRKTVADWLNESMGLDYTEDEVLVSSGGRPLIYATYRALIDSGDKVVFPTPSWNNNHYCYINKAEAIMVETDSEKDFMPTAELLEDHIKDATLLALCSPLNPTGTAFSKENLQAICDMVWEENQRRDSSQKPLYIFYDQIYWTLTYGDTVHYNPVQLRPELRDVTISMDGISKAMAATGVRVGWATGPKYIIDKMKAILSHVGSWAPKSEQYATAEFISDRNALSSYLSEYKQKIEDRLDAFYNGFQKLKDAGFNVDAIAPQAAMYLTVQFDLKGKQTPDGDILNNGKEINQYVLNAAKVALVPFSSFGASTDSTWFRLAVGVAKMEDIEPIINQLHQALSQLK
ncbi:MAG: aminotransferase class I/II-fold pyridoxal phosphate-dependent enzyme [Bacteroidia bacterium]|nr:aminotransferase class I/II-fold pyridoxal phosphate-dependent enzyme [Bacteroidia bacterium]